ncbi:hypothetical protein FB451DRAFT_1537496 [Mycena latifolia]|nr:hypothetical protein FB451DRAFT_1537496 [Mycena latifolia]
MDARRCLGGGNLSNARELERLRRELQIARAESQRLRQDNRILAHSRREFSAVKIEYKHSPPHFKSPPLKLPSKHEIFEISEDEEVAIPWPSSKHSGSRSETRMLKLNPPQIRGLSFSPSLSPDCPLRVRRPTSPLSIPPGNNLSASNVTPPLSADRPPKRRKSLQTKRSIVTDPDYKPRINSAVNLPNDVVAAYLGDALPLEIKPLVTETVHFTREFLTDKNPQWIISLSSAPLKGRFAMFPTHELNPFMPRSPGESDVLFSFGCNSVNTPMKSSANDTAAICLSGPQVPRRVGMQHHEKTWAEYREMRARIGLCKLGSEISGASVAAEVQNIKRKAGIQVSPDDAMVALQRGEEVYAAFTLLDVANKNR